MPQLYEIVKIVYICVNSSAPDPPNLTIGHIKLSPSKAGRFPGMHSNRGCRRVLRRMRGACAKWRIFLRAKMGFRAEMARYVNNRTGGRRRAV